MPTLPAPRRPLLLAALLAASGCVAPPEKPAPVAPAAVEAPAPVQPAVNHAAELEDRDRQIAQLQLKLLARDADIARQQAELEEIKQRLDDAVLEIVRSKAKLGSLGSRAEAATSLSESELLLGSLRRERGVQASELTTAEKMLALGNKEFKNGNYGGAFYLSSSAKTALGMVSSRLRGAVPAAGDASAETKFVLPVKLRIGARANIREAPRPDSRILRVADKGTAIVGIAHRDRWVLVEFEDGLRGWSFHDLLSAR